jgi:hypothetical protein
MKTIPTSSTKISATDRDAIIGSAISAELAATSPPDPCPDSEQVALLIDGGGSAAERDSFFAHIAVCDRCRAVYLLAHDLSSEEPVARNFRTWYLAGGTIAAAAVLLLAVKLTVQESALPKQVAQSPFQQAQVMPITPGQELAATTPATAKDSPFSPIAAARQLAKAAPVDTLAAAIGTAASASYGFAGGGSQQASAIRAGKELFEVELWLAAGDKERAGLAAERLLPLLRDVGGSTAPPGELFRQIEKGDIDDVTRQLEAILTSSHGGIIRLGSWIAAARLATETGADPYFSANPPQQFLKELEGGLTPAARATLAKLDKNKRSTKPAEFRRLLDTLSVEIQAIN